MTFRADLTRLVSESTDPLLAAAPSWHRVSLGSVAGILNGFAFPSSGFSRSEGMPLLRIRDIDGRSTETSFVGRYEDAYRVPTGSLVVGMDGDFHVAEWAGPEALLNQRVCRIAVKDSRLYSERFLRWVLPGYLALINRNTPSLTVKHLSSETVKSIPLPLPPRAEQERITAAIEEQFSHLDAAMGDLLRVRGNCSRMRASVLQAAASGRLVMQDPAEGSGRDIVGSERSEGLRTRRSSLALTTKLELPDHWAAAPWSQVGRSQNGRIFSSKDYTSSGTRLLRPGNLYVSGTTSWTESNTRRLPERYAIEFPEYLVGRNEILMNLTAQSLKDEFLGRVCMTGDEDEPALLNQRIARLTPIGLNPRFVFWILKSPLFRRFVDQLNTGSLIQHMFTSQLDEFVLPIPPLGEQGRIVAKIEDMMRSIELLDQTASRSAGRIARLRSSVLGAAFGGALVPQDPGDERASTLLAKIPSGPAPSRYGSNQRRPAIRPGGKVRL
jgi:type I restriction enzyme S subunit